jgi:hypothetical protein
MLQTVCVCVCVCVCMCVYACIRVSLHMCACVCVYVCMHVYVSLSIRVCIYVYIHTHTDTHIYTGIIHINIHAYRCSKLLHAALQILKIPTMCLFIIHNSSSLPSYVHRNIHRNHTCIPVQQTSPRCSPNHQYTYYVSLHHTQLFLSLCTCMHTYIQASFT